MNFLTLTVVVLIIVFIAYVLKRRWQTRKPVASQAQQALAASLSEIPKHIAPEKINSRLIPALTNRVRGWRGRIAKQKEPSLAEKLHTWSNQALAENQMVKQWLDTLPEEVFADFAQALASFCNQMNFELTWLFDHTVDQQPALAQMLAEVVIDYARACRTAALAQPDISIFKTYQAFVQSPYEKAHQAFAQKLFTQLVERNLTPTIPPKLFMAAEHERQLYMVQAIQQAAEKRPTEFAQALRTVMAEAAAFGDSLDAPVTASTPVTTQQAATASA